MATDDKKPPPDGQLDPRRREMLERLRSLGNQRDERKSDSDMWGPTTVEPLPPADQLLPEEQRPTIKQIPREVQRQVQARGAEIVDGVVTSKLERVPVEPTPAPLPPQPDADKVAQSWFEQVPTSPAPSIGPFGQIGTDSEISSVTPVQQRDGAHVTAATRPATRARGHRVTMQLGRPQWMLPALIAATALAVGMVLGALLFGGDSDDVPTIDPGTICAPCPEPSDPSPGPGDGLPD